MKYFLYFLVCFVLLTLPFNIKAESSLPRKIVPQDIKLEEGYFIEPAVVNLSVPTTAIFDGDDLLIAESGFANTAKPRILRVSKNGQVSALASDGLNPPVTGLLLIDGKLYISHRGKVSILDSSGNLNDIVTDLPSSGDHQNNNIVLGSDGKIYMGQGTTTNTGVVGEDNYLFGWLEKNTNIHELPCQDITLTGKNYESANPLTPVADKLKTGAYKPFGLSSTPGEAIKGSNKCGGSIVRFNKDGSNLELVAWGLRNPYGLEFDNNGQLWATYHGADDRGSRPVYNDPDYLIKVKEGAWYGWPEIFDNNGKQPDSLWANHPARELPFLHFNPHEAANGLTISPSSIFGFRENIFVAMYGTFAPVTSGPNLSPAGFRVVRVDPNTKQTINFASNSLPGPAYINQGGGFDRPSDLVFGPDESLYVVDWGAATLDKEGLKLVPQTGMVWRIYSKNQTAKFTNGPVTVNDESIKLEYREPLVKNALPLYKQLLPILLPVFIVIFLIIYFLIRKFKIK